MSTDPRIGTRVGEYQIERMLGRGGMSVVYLAEQERLKRKTALKLLSPELAEDPTFRARFVSEWERLAQLDHPNIIPVFEAGEADGLLYIAMRYVQSTDLKGLIEQEGHLDPSRAIAIVAQTASALDAAHEHDLVHRDVKPANILIAVGAGPEGSDHVYLSDFGLTKHTQSESGLTKTGHFMGTIDYVAPEQISGKGVDGRTDQYALGCVLYQCLTGAVPFPRDEETAALFAHLQDPAPRPTMIRPELPSAIDEVIARAMAKDKDERFGSCTAFARAARTALGVPGASAAPHEVVAHRPTRTVLAAPPPAARVPGGPPTELPSAPSAPVRTPPPATGEGTGRPRGGRRGLLVGVAIAVVAIAGVVAAISLGGGDGEPSTTGTGATGVSTPVGPTGLEFSTGRIAVLDSFNDPSTGWETRPQHGIDRAYTDAGTYRFTITDAAQPDSFAVSVGPGRAVDLADTYVSATARVVGRGDGGVANSLGLSCRQTGTSAYYILIGISGRWAVQELLPGESAVTVLAQGKDVAIARGEETNVVEVRCFDAPDGSSTVIQLIVNGKQVGQAVDTATRIASGAAGLALVGQPGFAVEFDDFIVSDLIVTDTLDQPSR